MNRSSTPGATWSQDRTSRPRRRLLAISDLHIEHAENRGFVARFTPTCEEDWLILSGDVSDSLDDVEWALKTLTSRFERVIWVPGNHELLAHPNDPPGLRGDTRYRTLVNLCRRLGVLTPEDPHPVWDDGAGGISIVPLFTLYDYSFGRNIAASSQRSLELAHAAGVVCVDECLLDPSPFASRQEWCAARIRISEQRLEAYGPDRPTVLVSHFPLIDAPTRALARPEFAQWCGTTRTADWHLRFGARVVVYGHLHIPRTTWHDGVRFEEVSLGYPGEPWRRRPRGPRQILPDPTVP